MSALPSQPARDLDIAIIIVNFRTAGLTVDCLASLLDPPNLPDKSHILVVDGASGDMSVEVIGDAIREHGWQDRVSFFPLEDNRGFAYANNRGIDYVIQNLGRPRYLHLLNPDTVVRPGGVGALVDFMERNPEVGIAGSLLEDPDGTPHSCAFRFPTIPAELESEARLGPLTRLLEPWRVAPKMGKDPSRVDWVAGASMLFRAELLDTVGLLDEAYFLYYEEVDYCLQAARAGWQCWYVPQSRVVHLVGQSTGVTRRRNPNRRPAYWFHSRRRFYLKNYGALYAAGVDASWLLGHLIRRMRLLAKGRISSETPFILKDFLAHAWSSRLSGAARSGS